MPYAAIYPKYASLPCSATYPKYAPLPCLATYSKYTLLPCSATYPKYALCSNLPKIYLMQQPTQNMPAALFSNLPKIYPMQQHTKNIPCSATYPKYALFSNLPKIRSTSLCSNSPWGFHEQTGQSLPSRLRPHASNHINIHGDWGVWLTSLPSPLSKTPTVSFVGWMLPVLLTHMPALLLPLVASSCLSWPGGAPRLFSTPAVESWLVHALMISLTYSGIAGSSFFSSVAGSVIPWFPSAVFCRQFMKERIWWPPVSCWRFLRNWGWWLGCQRLQAVQRSCHTHSGFRRSSRQLSWFSCVRMRVILQLLCCRPVCCGCTFVLRGRGSNWSRPGWRTSVGRVVSLVRWKRGSGWTGFGFILSLWFLPELWLLSQATVPWKFNQNHNPWSWHPPAEVARNTVLYYLSCCIIMLMHMQGNCCANNSPGLNFQV